MGGCQSGARGFVIIDFGLVRIGKGCFAQKVCYGFGGGLPIGFCGDFGPHILAK